VQKGSMQAQGAITFRIRRFQPAEQPSPYYQEYYLPLNRESTLLDGLIYIREELDGTLAFRCSCRSAICGSCGLRVNDKAVLACHTRIGEVLDSQDQAIIVLEPLRNLPVIKDLIVDFGEIFSRLEKIQPWLNTAGHRPPANSEHLVMPDQQYHDLNRIDVCILCGICFSECPVMAKDRSFLGPVALVKSRRFLLDSRDVASRGRLQQLLEMGILKCQEFDHCPVECPKGISLAEDIMRPLQEQIRELGIAE